MSDTANGGVAWGMGSLMILFFLLTSLILRRFLMQDVVFVF
jgi:hypothetical protein